ncbi:MAG: hypothetical protein R3F61_13045 [Myxococcota bacterium]
MSRVCVLEWSLSGQSREVTDTFLAPLIDAGHEVVRVQLDLEVTYPFPWSPVQFFGIFPETVLERPPAARPIALPEGDFDLVVASGQIWYLRPCMPWQAFLASDQSEWLRGRRVLTLTTCRNMWVNGWRRWVQRLQERGAVVTDRVTVTHSGPVFASFFSTLAWSVTGDRHAVKALPKVEIDGDTLARVRQHGSVLASRLAEGREGVLLEGEDTAPVSPAHAFGELTVGATLFPILASVYAALSSPGTLLRAFFALFQMGFVISLVLVLVFPFLAIHALFRARIDAWVNSMSRLPVGTR